MNPMMIMMALSALGSAVGGPGSGQNAQFGSTYNPQQLDFMKQGLGGLNPGMGDITQNQNYQQGSDWLSALFNDPEFFKNFEAPLMRQFEEETVPGLANRFAGMGSGGATGSTAFRNQLAREGSTLHEKIAALRGGLQQQGVNQSLQYGQQPVQNYLQQLQQMLQPTNNVYQPATGGFFGDILGSLAGGAAKGYGQKFGESMV